MKLAAATSPSDNGPSAWSIHKPARSPTALNKSDEKQAVTLEQVKALTDQRVMETSARTGQGLDGLQQFVAGVQGDVDVDFDGFHIIKD